MGAEFPYHRNLTSKQQRGVRKELENSALVLLVPFGANGESSILLGKQGLPKDYYATSDGCAEFLRRKIGTVGRDSIHIKGYEEARQRPQVDEVIQVVDKYLNPAKD